MSRAQLTSTVEQNTGGAVAPFLAGKNKIINGDFSVTQRGSSFSSNASYTLDRWYMIWDGSGATRAVSQQTFVPGTGYASGDSITASAPVGFYGANFLRYNQSVAGSGGTYSVFQQKIEDVHTFAGQTVTFSFWAKASSTVSLGTYLNQNFGTSGSSDTNTSIVYQTVTTAWQRFAITISVQSISGKTIGTNSFLMVPFVMPLNSTFTIDICGVQLEAGSVATPFTTASNTLQGELALCQRYFWQISSANIDRVAAQAISSTRAFGPLPLPVTMRTAPSYSFAAASNFGLINSSGGVLTCTTVSIAAQATNMVTLDFTSSGGGLTAGNATACWFQSTSSTIALSAEL